MTKELARHLTVGCLETLALGQTPTWERYRQRPDDPTPTYKETVLATGYDRALARGFWTEVQARHQRERERIEQGSRHHPLPRQQLAQVPIPSRPLSYAVSRRTDPATSREAAASVVDPSKGTYRRILSLLRTFRDGLTDEQLLDEWTCNAAVIPFDAWPPISPSGLRSRRNELTRRGLIVDSGERAKTRAGRRSIVWRLP